MENTTKPNLAEYVGLAELLAAVKHTFPSVESAKWFTRQHRAELAERGALIEVTGRLRYHPARFQESAVEIGKRNLLRREARQ